MNRIISLIISLSVLCMCLVCNITVGASEDVPTEYGTIPADYADSSQYPIAVFKKDGTFLKATNIFADNTSACGLYYIRNDYSVNQGKYLLLREDMTTGSYPSVNYHYTQAVTIDLGGHTLTITSNYLFTVVQRFAKDVNITFKNGTIVYPDRIFSYGDSGSWTGGAKFSFTFQDITFVRSGDTGSANGFASGNAGADPIECTLNFNNCIFDISQKDSSVDTTLFSTEFESVSSHITITGGKIVASDCDTLRIYSVESDDDFVIFNPDENGEYTKLILPSVASGCTETIIADGGEAVYVVADDDGEFATYILKADFIAIPDIIINRAEFYKSGETNIAKAVVRNMTDSEITIIMIVAAYDENDVITSVKVREQVVSTVAELETELDEAENYALFFLNDRESLTAVDGIIYTSGEDWKPEDSMPKDSASASYISSSYDVASETILISGEGFGEPGDALCVNVISSGTDISEDNPPVISAVYHWNDNGTVNIILPVSSNIESGKYDILLSGNGMESIHKTGVLIFRQDSDETQNALGDVNDTGSYDDFHAQITSNSFALGIDYLSENEWEVMTKVMYGVKCADGDFIVETLSVAANYSRAVVLLESGESVDNVMQTYAPVFGTTYENYSSLSDGVKSKLNNLILKSDFYDGYIDYNSLCYVAKAAGCESYEELKNLITDNSEIYEADVEGDYRKLSVNNKGKVFRRMYSERDSFNTISDISKSFEEAVDYYSEADKGGSGSGGGSSGKKPSGGVSFGGGSGATSITLPATGSNESDKVNDDAGIPAGSAEKYSDIKNHFAYDDIMYLSDLGILNGYSDGTYRPNGNVTRAELCKIVSLAFDITSSSGVEFDDVATDAWYFGSVSALAGNGIVLGDGSDFNPDDNVTRQDCAVILHRALSHCGKAVDGEFLFADSSDISEYALRAVEAMASHGIMNGDEAGFRPLDSLTRGELAAVISRVMKGGETNEK